MTALNSSDPLPTPPRKPAGLTWESFVDRRIREAEAAGQFDNLPGAGCPIPGVDDPLDDDWWLKRKLREEQLSIVPPILEAKLARERLFERLPAMTSEADVRQALIELNARIRAAIASPAPGPSVALLPVEIELTVAEWRRRRNEIGGQPSAQARTRSRNANPRST